MTHRTRNLPPIRADVACDTFAQVEWKRLTESLSQYGVSDEERKHDVPNCGRLERNMLAVGANPIHKQFEGLVHQTHPTGHIIQRLFDAHLYLTIDVSGDQE